MKSIRTRMTVIFVGLMMAMIAVIWGINKWYLEKYYITEKVESFEAAYDAFNWQLESNAERGISIQEAMKREQDADGNIKEGNLQKLFRDRGTVDSNKGFIPSSAQLMDCTGDDFFTRAAFTNHHNAGWAGCNTANESF